MLYSKKPAFSAFELLCVVMIVAILASIGVRYLGYVSHKQCLLHLKAQLSHAQNALSVYYTDSFIREEKVDSAYAYSLLSNITRTNRAQCGFVLEPHRLTATIGIQSLSFSIEPSTFLVNPKIFCPLALPLCKDFTDRILDK